MSFTVRPDHTVGYTKWMTVASFLVCLLFSPLTLAWPAKVVDVTAGDMVTVMKKDNGQKFQVRIQGIDTPETDHGPGRPGQPYGKQAQKHLKQLLSGADVDVQPHGARSYDRIVGRITADGRDVGKVMVADGMAWDYPHYDADGRYATEQRAAKLSHRGLWSQPEPVPPWDWRRDKWFE